MSEHVLMVLAVVVAAAIRLAPDGVSESLVRGVLWRGSLIALVLQVCLYFCDLYNFRTLGDRRSAAVAMLRALGASSLVLALLYYWIPGLVIGRGVFAIAAVLFVVLVAGWRLAFHWLAGHLQPVERLLIVGTNPAAVELARELCSARCGTMPRTRRARCGPPREIPG